MPQWFLRASLTLFNSKRLPLPIGTTPAAMVLSLSTRRLSPKELLGSLKLGDADELTLTLREPTVASPTLAGTRTAQSGSTRPQQATALDLSVDPKGVKRGKCTQTGCACGEYRRKKPLPPGDTKPNACAGCNHGPNSHLDVVVSQNQQATISVPNTEELSLHDAKLGDEFSAPNPAAMHVVTFPSLGGITADFCAKCNLKPCNSDAHVKITLQAWITALLNSGGGQLVFGVSKCNDDGKLRWLGFPLSDEALNHFEEQLVNLLAFSPAPPFSMASVHPFAARAAAAAHKISHLFYRLSGTTRIVLVITVPAGMKPVYFPSARARKPPLRIGSSKGESALPDEEFDARMKRLATIAEDLFKAGRESTLMPPTRTRILHDAQLQLGSQWKLHNEGEATEHKAVYGARPEDTIVRYLIDYAAAFLNLSAPLTLALGVENGTRRVNGVCLRLAELDKVATRALSLGQNAAGEPTTVHALVPPLPLHAFELIAHPVQVKIAQLLHNNGCVYLLTTAQRRELLKHIHSTEQRPDFPGRLVELREAPAGFALPLFAVLLDSSDTNRRTNIGKSVEAKLASLIPLEDILCVQLPTPPSLHLWCIRFELRPTEFEPAPLYFRSRPKAWIVHPHTHGLRRLDVLELIGRYRSELSSSWATILDAIRHYSRPLILLANDLSPLPLVPLSNVLRLPWRLVVDLDSSFRELGHFYSSVSCALQEMPSSPLRLVLGTDEAVDDLYGITWLSVFDGGAPKNAREWRPMESHRRFHDQLKAFHKCLSEDPVIVVLLHDNGSEWESELAAAMIEAMNGYWLAGVNVLVATDSHASWLRSNSDFKRLCPPQWVIEVSLTELLHRLASEAPLPPCQEVGRCELPCRLDPSMAHAVDRKEVPLALQGQLAEKVDLVHLGLPRQSTPNYRNPRFWEGEEISWCDLANGLAIERNIEENLVKRIERQLHTYVDFTQPFPIWAEPGAGATTLGRKLLWHFSTKFPCLQLRSFYKDLDKHLQQLSRMTGFTIIMLIDIPLALQEEKIHELVNRLAGSRVFILQVKVVESHERVRQVDVLRRELLRTPLVQRGVSRRSEFDHFMEKMLSQTIDPATKGELQVLWQIGALDESPPSERTAFFVQFTAFKAKYCKLTDRVTQALGSLRRAGLVDGLIMLRIMAFAGYWATGDSSPLLPVDVLRPGCRDRQEFLRCFSFEALDLLLYPERDQNGVLCTGTRHWLIDEEILRLNPEVKCSEFAADFVRHCGSAVRARQRCPPALERIIQSLFLRRPWSAQDADDSRDPRKTDFSRLVTSVISESDGVRKVTRLFDHLIAALLRSESEAFPGAEELVPHLLAHSARVQDKCLADEEGSLERMERAERILPNDPELQHIHGMLYSEQCKRRLEHYSQDRESATQEARTTRLSEALRCAIEASGRFSDAPRLSSRQRMYSFTADLSLRSEVLTTISKRDFNACLATASPSPTARYLAECHAHMLELVDALPPEKVPNSIFRHLVDDPKRTARLEVHLRQRGQNANLSPEERYRARRGKEALIRARVNAVKEIGRLKDNQALLREVIQDHKLTLEEWPACPPHVLPRLVQLQRWCDVGSLDESTLSASFTKLLALVKQTTRHVEPLHQMYIRLLHFIALFHGRVHEAPVVEPYHLTHVNRRRPFELLTRELRHQKDAWSLRCLMSNSELAAESGADVHHHDDHATIRSNQRRFHRFSGIVKTQDRLGYGTLAFLADDKHHLGETKAVIWFSPFHADPTYPCLETNRDVVEFSLAFSPSGLRALM